MKITTNTGIICGKCADVRKQRWQEKNKNTVIQAGGYCKLAFNLDGYIEHMWVLVTSVNQKASTIKGSLDNDPLYIKSIKCGDDLEFTTVEIEDYLNDQQ